MASLSAVGALVLVFPLLDTFRRTTDTVLEVQGPLSSLAEADFDGFGQILNTVWWVETNGISWGNQLLGVLLFWVPRSLWEAKPQGTGSLLADARGYSFDNLSAPLPAELYINGSWLAVVVGMILLGFLMRRADQHNDGEIDRSGAPTVLGAILPFYMILLLRGSLIQAAATLAVILFSWFVCSKPTGRQMDRLAASGLVEGSRDR